MERISRQKLCDDFDNILDRVDKEDTGFVISMMKVKTGMFFVLLIGWITASMMTSGASSTVPCGIPLIDTHICPVWL